MERLPVILHLSQDDPRKCTARKLARLRKARLVTDPGKLPFGALLLDPFSDRAVAPDDVLLVRTRGLVAVDCSWEAAEEVFSGFRSVKRMQSRALPMLLASNPTKFGKWGELSTLEAIAAVYYIIGEKETASDLLSAYTWGHRFLEVNHEPLEAYSKCGDSGEVVRVQMEFY